MIFFFFFCNCIYLCCPGHGSSFYSCSLHNRNTSRVTHPSDANMAWDIARQILAKPTEASSSRAACVYIAIDIFRIRLSATKLVAFQPLLPLHCNWWQDEDCGEHWIGVLAFLTELAIFELSEASGGPCFMDFISVSYGLRTGLANCVKRGEATGQWEQPVRNLHRGPNGAASYVRNKDSSRRVLTAYSGALQR